MRHGALRRHLSVHRSPGNGVYSGVVLGVDSAGAVEFPDWVYGLLALLALRRWRIDCHRDSLVAHAHGTRYAAFSLLSSAILFVIFSSCWLFSSGIGKLDAARECGIRRLLYPALGGAAFAADHRLACLAHAIGVGRQRHHAHCWPVLTPVVILQPTLPSNGLSSAKSPRCRRRWGGGLAMNGGVDRCDTAANQRRCGCFAAGGGLPGALLIRPKTITSFSPSRWAGQRGRRQSLHRPRTGNLSDRDVAAR